jgi:sulfur carrier protein
MSIKFTLRKQEFEMAYTDDLTVKKALKSLNLLPEAYLVVRNGELVVEQALLRDGDDIKLVPVISGGSR